ncbi:hypothetical protein NOVOSPHI9U_40231 [Novosphingobium sp. 9U]|nr:hypothetical protein NOVOSPHI9U_40231 [Novosphingobium sp. 9U]
MGHLSIVGFRWQRQDDFRSEIGESLPLALRAFTLLQTHRHPGLHPGALLLFARRYNPKLRPERQHPTIALQRRCPGHMHPALQQKHVPHDLGLLLQAIALQPPPRSQHIIVAAQRMAHQGQVPAAAMLGLPDVRHLMQEQRLRLQASMRKIIYIKRRARVEVDVAGRCHQRVHRLEREPAAALHPYRLAVDLFAEDRADQRALAGGERSLPAGQARAIGRRLAQWFIPAMPPASAPMASTFAGIEILSPSAKVSVSSL